MSKPKIGIAAWLGSFLGTSHKVISEKLSAEEYNLLVADAEKYRASIKAEDDDSDDDDDQDDDDEQDDDTDSTDPKNKDPKSATIEARLAALEQGLGAAKSALKTEKKEHKATAAKLTEAQQKLEKSEAQKGKLRQAVNPLGDQDITDQDAKNVALTKVDIEARAAWKKNHPTA